MLGKAKGYYGARRKVYRVAKQAVIKAGQYAYRDRRQRKRQFRALWIARINAAARETRTVLQPDDRRSQQGEIEIDGRYWQTSPFLTGPDSVPWRTGPKAG